MLVRKINIIKQDVMWEKKQQIGGSNFDTRDLEYFVESCYSKNLNNIILSKLFDSIGPITLYGAYFDHPNITPSDDTDECHFYDIFDPQTFNHVVHIGNDAMWLIKKSENITAFVNYAALHYTSVVVYDTASDVCLLYFSKRNKEPPYINIWEKIESNLAPTVTYDIQHPDIDLFSSAVLTDSESWLVNQLLQ